MKKTFFFLILLVTSLCTFSQGSISGIKYGALAIDRGNGFYYGWSYDFSTLADAEQKALAECASKGGNCTVVMTFSGSGCAAYRTIDGTVGNAYGWGFAKTKEEADRIATAECAKRSSGKPATNYVWACNSNNAGPLRIITNLIPSPNQLFGLKDIDGDSYDYEGEVSGGLPNGIGTQTFPSKGQRYTGSFKNGYRNGKGTFYWKSGARYDGEFKNDRMDGFGTYLFATGRKYVGELKNGKLHGEGKIYDASGNLNSQGRYVEGKLVSQ